MQQKRAILVVSFGTSYHETCEKNIAAIEREIADAFPGWDIRRAFTSSMILRKLKKRDNVIIDTVEEALERLHADGYGTVLCQPTHIINGEEFEDVARAVAACREKFDVIRLGAPLLTDTKDYMQLASIIGSAFPLDGETALCLMGHGTSHPADSAYAALDYHFKSLGHRAVFVGTVEGFPDLETVLAQIEPMGAKKVILTPLMVVAGDHAVNDMASDEEDSWKTAFQKAGYVVECIVKGLGEYPEIRRMYVDHVRRML